MQAAPRHDIGLAAEDSRGCFFDVHQLEQAQRPLGMIEEQVDIGILACLRPHGRAEQEEMLHAEPPQLGFVLLELGKGCEEIQDRKSTRLNSSHMSISY